MSARRGANVVGNPTKEYEMDPKKITAIKVAPGRTMLVYEGRPVLVSFDLRNATSAPARLKARLSIETEGDLPSLPLGDEFRLEMN